MYSIRTALIPAGYKGYPISYSNANDSFIEFQVLTLNRGHNTYVAAESKVYKYDHVIFYAQFQILGTKAILVNFEAVSVEYGYSSPDEDTLTNEVLLSEIMMMMPPGTTDLVIECGTETNGLVKFNTDPYSLSPKAIFDYEHHFNPVSSKRDTLELKIAA